MKKKVLIIGSTGMLGSAVINQFIKNKKINLSATYREKKDLNILKKILKFKKPRVKWIKFSIKGNYEKKLKKIIKNKDYIINCTGIIKPYINEKNFKSIKEAILINSIFPHNLNNLKEKNTKILQIATDCVYDGKEGFYKESFSHNATDVYGKSKSLGEVESENFFNIRCSIIGKEIKGFKSLVNWFLSNKKNSNLNGFSNHLWNGITTNFFAKFLLIIIIKNVKIPNLIHLTPSNYVNKYELLKIFAEKLERGDLQIAKSKSTNKVNRVIVTKHKKLIQKISNYMGFKSIPSVKKIIDETL